MNKDGNNSGYIKRLFNAKLKLNNDNKIEFEF